jgi:ATP/maltotriose-dependent transcriptional regulator MalT
MDNSQTEILTQSAAVVTSAGQSFRPPAHEQSAAQPRVDGDALDRSNVTLSARERAIVFLMSHGLSNKQIARQLSIAPETVKSHAKRIFLKLTVCSRAQAVYQAVALGLIALH